MSSKSPVVENISRYGLAPSKKKSMDLPIILHLRRNSLASGPNDANLARIKKKLGIFRVVFFMS